jgi:hypothetical protein
MLVHGAAQSHRPSNVNLYSECVAMRRLTKTPGCLEPNAFYDLIRL